MEMPSVVFTGNYKPLTLPELAEFEQSVGLTLPASYRAFLLRNNGGSPHKHCLEKPFGCYIQSFFAVIEAPLHMSLRENMMSDELQEGTIAIGFTGSGDRICLRLNDGRIFLWDHEMEYAETRARADELVFLANNIDELLSNLEGDDPPPVDDEVMRLGRWGDFDALLRYLSQGNDINALSSTGETIVKSAAREGHVEFIKECSRRGASLNGALHAALFAQQLSVIEFLLEQGVDPNELDQRGYRPLDLVPGRVYARRPPFVKLVESKGGIRTPDEE